MAGAHITLKIVDTDCYGRRIAEVFASGKLLQVEQTRSGRAYVYDRYLNNCPDAAVVHRAEAIALSSSINPYYFCRVPLLSSSMLAFSFFKNVGTALYRLCSALVGCSNSGKLINSSNAASIFRSTFSF